MVGSSARAETLPLTPEGTEENYANAAEDFCFYLNYTGGKDVADFVRFQFDDDDLVQIFFDGGEEEQVKRLKKAYDVLKASPEFHAVSEL